MRVQRQVAQRTLGVFARRDPHYDRRLIRRRRERAPRPNAATRENRRRGEKDAHGPASPIKPSAKALPLPCRGRGTRSRLRVASSSSSAGCVPLTCSFVSSPRERVPLGPTHVVFDEGYIPRAPETRAPPGVGFSVPIPSPRHAPATPRPLIPSLFRSIHVGGSRSFRGPKWDLTPHTGCAAVCQASHWPRGRAPFRSTRPHYAGAWRGIGGGEGGQTARYRRRCEKVP